MAQNPANRMAQSIESCRKAVALQPGNLALRIKLADLLTEAGALGDAEDEYRSILESQPASQPAAKGMARIASLWRQRGRALKKEGKADQSIEAFQRFMACTRQPDIDALLDFGVVLHQRNRNDEALKIWQQALRVKPDSATAHHNLGVLLRRRKQKAKAYEMLRKALKLDPTYANSVVTLTNMLLEDGQYDEAIEVCRKALAVKADLPEVTASLAGIYERQGEVRQAYDLVLPLVEAGSKSVPVISEFSKVCHRLSPPEASAVPLLLKALERTDLDWRGRKGILTSLANLCDALDRHEEAFRYLRQGRTLEPVDEAALKQRAELMNIMRESYSVERLKRLPRATPPSELPIFILGMPRSGTTLAEQILASHPRAHGAGELTHIGRIAVSGFRTDLPYPKCLDAVTLEQVNALAAEHLDYLRSLAPEADRVVDKMPLNFLHLGAIQLLFPGAKVIHCVRHPLDTCISIFFNEFSDSLPFTRDLTALGNYYLGYTKLMAHWKSVLEVPILDFPYEEVVADTETHVRRLLDFCGLEWNDACLRFYEKKRHVDTPSYHQVRKPIYTRSVGRYKVYNPWLGPLKEALGDALDGWATD